MKNLQFLFALALCIVLTLSACGKPDPENPEQSQPLPQQEWPAKKISRIVHSVGTLNYMTFDFDWDNGVLNEIRCTYYDGSFLGRTVLEYNDGHLYRVFPCDKDDVAYPDGAMYYHYDANGRLASQNFILPIRQDNNLCQATYNEAVPCELVYSYTADGKVSEVLATKTLNNGSTESLTYRFNWEGNNVTAVSRISADGERILFSGMHYDDKRNPMAFPMGIETMGTDLIMEGVWGNAYIFLAYAFSWSANNMTTLISGNGQCTYTYDDDGYVLSKTIAASGQSSTYTFTYCE